MQENIEQSKTINLQANGNVQVTLPKPLTTDLAISGGGVKGVATAGAIAALDEANVLPQIKNVVGASAGAMNAMLLALGMPSEKITNMLLEINITKYIDFGVGHRDDGQNLRNFMAGIVREQFHEILTKHVDMDKVTHSSRHAEIYHKLFEKVAAKDKITFKDLDDLRSIANQEYANKIKGLHVVITNKSESKQVVCSAEETPDVDIATAVQVSGAHPIMFQSFRDTEGIFGKKGQKYNDGGIMDNVPIRVLQQHKNEHMIGKSTLSLIFSDDKHYNQNQASLGTEKPDSLFTKIVNKTVGNALKPVIGANWLELASLTSQKVHENSHKTIILNSGTITTTKTNATLEEKEKAIALSKQGTKEYLELHKDEVQIHNFNGGKDAKDNLTAIAFALTSQDLEYFIKHPEKIHIHPDTDLTTKQITSRLELVQTINGKINQVAAQINTKTEDFSSIKENLEKMKAMLPDAKYLPIVEERLDILTKSQFSNHYKQAAANAPESPKMRTSPKTSPETSPEIPHLSPSSSTSSENQSRRGFNSDFSQAKTNLKQMKNILTEGREAEKIKKGENTDTSQYTQSYN